MGENCDSEVKAGGNTEGPEMNPSLVLSTRKHTRQTHREGNLCHFLQGGDFLITVTKRGSFNHSNKVKEK